VYITVKVRLPHRPPTPHLPSKKLVAEKLVKNNDAVVEKNGEKIINFNATSMFSSQRQFVAFEVLTAVVMKI
jgi:hypothetical protein